MPYVTKRSLVLVSKHHVNVSRQLFRRDNSWWTNVSLAPPDAIFGVTEAFKKDSNSKKINLGVGAYRTDEGKPFILPSVRKAEEKIFARVMNHEYATQAGVAEFIKVAPLLAFGQDACIVKEGLNATVQTISGTGALRIAGQFLHKFFPCKKIVYMPKPTWGNHKTVFNHSGLETGFYKYYDPKTIGLDFCGMITDLRNLPDKSIILLHAVAHNPTGVDPDKEQWKEISKVCLEKQFMIFFDMAYQGFASGDPDEDAFAVRHFVDEGHKIILAQSFAKNMGLYGERAGCFTVVCTSQDEQKRVFSHLKGIVRGMYSNPPIYGARIVAEILSDQQLFCLWREDVKGMADRIKGARKALVENLKKAGSQKNWDHIVKQIGMFCYTGLTEEQVNKISKEHSVYFTKDGRISVAGVGSKNVEYLAQSIHAVTK